MVEVSTMMISRRYWCDGSNLNNLPGLHDYREPIKKPLGETGGGQHDSGAENEIWSVFEVCKICTVPREDASLCKRADAGGT